MPSYRLQLEVLDARPGVPPGSVLDAAVARVTSTHHLDACDLDVVAGTARIVLRFTVPPSSAAEEDADARALAHATRDATARVAVVGRLWLLRREGGGWAPRRLW